MTRTNRLKAQPQQFLRAEPRRDSTAAPSASVLGEFAAMLECSGLHKALGYLNGRIRFRFTGVYRFEATTLVNECLYDRENPSLDQSGTVLQLPDTYCAIARVTGRVFRTEDSTADPRLEGHSARHTVISYNGMPIRMEDGLIAGVLCHYDLRPRILPDEELEILEGAAARIALWSGPALSVAVKQERSP
ncbi:MAG: GAF domain-containing protein [Gemmatimonadales bacterium]